MKFSHLTRIYTKSSLFIGQIIKIEDDKFHHLKYVMRFKTSDQFRIFNDKDGEFLVKITKIERSNITVIVESLLRNITIRKDLTLAICVIKTDRMLEAIKGAVQLGITKIIPIISSRVQHSKIAQDKIMKAIIQSTEQSEQFFPAILLSPMSLQDFCRTHQSQQIIFACESENKNNLIRNIDKIENNSIILIGSEGGFSDDEITFLKSHQNIISVSLGDSVLRSEIAAISLIAYIKMISD